MSKLLTALTLALAMTFAASAYADSAMEDSDLYKEAIWDIHLSFGEDAFATQSASLQTASSAQTGASRASLATSDETNRERDGVE